MFVGREKKTSLELKTNRFNRKPHLISYSKIYSKVHSQILQARFAEQRLKGGALAYSEFGDTPGMREIHLISFCANDHLSIP